MNWLEVDNGFLVNLEKVKAIQKNENFTSTIYFKIGDVIESVQASIPYETLKSILNLRRSGEEASIESTNLTLKKILSGQSTLVP